MNGSCLPAPLLGLFHPHEFVDELIIANQSSLERSIMAIGFHGRQDGNQVEPATVPGIKLKEDVMRVIERSVTVPAR